MGWWPSRAITFIENHDTGSTQVGHSLYLSIAYELVFLVKTNFKPLCITLLF